MSEDIIHLQAVDDAILRKRGGKKFKPRWSRDVSRPVCLYGFFFPEFGLTKVGFSENLSRRHEALAATWGHCERIFVLHGGAFALERERILHSLLWRWHEVPPKEVGTGGKWGNGKTEFFRIPDDVRIRDDDNISAGESIKRLYLEARELEKVPGGFFAVDTLRIPRSIEAWRRILRHQFEMYCPDFMWARKSI